jgi:hypothetical protein
MSILSGIKRAAELYAAYRERKIEREFLLGHISQESLLHKLPGQKCLEIIELKKRIEEMGKGACERG